MTGQSIARTNQPTHGTRRHDDMAAAKENVSGNVLTDLSGRFPRWHIWISSAGRWWATRRGNAQLAKDAHPGWYMTVDADSPEELEALIKEQVRCDDAPVQEQGYSKT